MAGCVGHGQSRNRFAAIGVFGVGIPSECRIAVRSDFKFSGHAIVRDKTHTARHQRPYNAQPSQCVWAFAPYGHAPRDTQGQRYIFILSGCTCRDQAITLGHKVPPAVDRRMIPPRIGQCAAVGQSQARKGMKRMIDARIKPPICNGEKHDKTQDNPGELRTGRHHGRIFCAPQLPGEQLIGCV